MTDRRDRLPARQSSSTSRRKKSGGRSRQETLPPATASAVPQRLRGGRVRCAIYTRRSSEEGLEQEFNSLDAQRDACEAYIRSQKHEGWQALPQVYDDPGLSGGNMERPALKRLLADITLLRARLDRLQDLDGGALREEWRRLCRSEPPRTSRNLLLRAIAYRLQEVEFGGLPRWARQSLSGSSSVTGPSLSGELAPKPAGPRLKPGARLVREWHGRTHSVLVRDNGFEFEGRRYRSLTQIAREITGAHWSGPRFFGFGKRHGGSGSNRAPALLVGAVEASEITKGKQADESADELARASSKDASKNPHGRRVRCAI